MITERQSEYFLILSHVDQQIYVRNSILARLGKIGWREEVEHMEKRGMYRTHEQIYFEYARIVNQSRNLTEEGMKFNSTRPHLSECWFRLGEHQRRTSGIALESPDSAAGN